MRIALQPAFILHHRPYRETSLLIDLLTYDYGRVAVVARGVRKERSKTKAFLQPFTPLLVSWQGRSELMTLAAAEASAIPFNLQGNCLLGAFYLNELMMRLLHKHDPHPALFNIYQQTLVDLQGKQLQQAVLRIFEKKLLEEIGYGLQLEYSIPDKKPLMADQDYYFYPEQGFVLCVGEKKAMPVFSGKSLLALASENMTETESLQEIKRLMRMVLSPLLGAQPLHSRKLFLEVDTK